MTTDALRIGGVIIPVARGAMSWSPVVTGQDERGQSGDLFDLEQANNLEASLDVVPHGREAGDALTMHVDGSGETWSFVDVLGSLGLGPVSATGYALANDATAITGRRVTVDSAGEIAFAVALTATTRWTVEVWRYDLATESVADVDEWACYHGVFDGSTLLAQYRDGLPGTYGLGEWCGRDGLNFRLRGKNVAGGNRAVRYTQLVFRRWRVPAWMAFQLASERDDAAPGLPYHLVRGQSTPSGLEPMTCRCRATTIELRSQGAMQSSVRERTARGLRVTIRQRDGGRT